eukprot:6188261-Pleurochrysis_carterae.AAC.4
MQMNEFAKREPSIIEEQNIKFKQEVNARSYFAASLHPSAVDNAAWFTEFARFQLVHSLSAERRC